MTSFTRRFSEAGTGPRLAVVLCGAVCFVAAHALFESTARYAERNLGAYLWRQEDYLRVFTPSYHVGRGANRLWIYGPSEAREGLLPEDIRPFVPDLEPYQNSQSIGTLEDGLLVLEYLERAYGPSAIPTSMLLGITPRFVADIRDQPSPLQVGIDRYSPHFVVEPGDPPHLARRTWVQSLEARAALLALEPERYRRGLFAIGSRAATALMPGLADYKMSWLPVSAAKYFEPEDRWSRDTLEMVLDYPGGMWEQVHAWDPRQHRESVRQGLERLLAFTRQHDIRLYVVNMPEHSLNRQRFDPDRYAAYLEIVTGVLSGTPFLDLREFLPDDAFRDDAHPIWSGARAVSRRVGAFVAEERLAVDTHGGGRP